MTTTAHHTSENPVIACYGGIDSVGALQLAATLAEILEQPLVLAVAYRYEPVALSARARPEDVTARRFDAAQVALGRARRLIPSVAVEVRDRVVPAESVPVALTDLARELSASVIVVGRDLGGSVTREILEHTPCPVAVSPFDLAVPVRTPIRRIAVAHDGSQAARYGREAATRLGELSGATVDILTAPDGVDAGAHLAVVSESYDLLVCGSRGRGRLTSLVLGSVSGHLVHAAHCPVLVIPPGVRHVARAPMALSTAG